MSDNVNKVEGQDGAAADAIHKDDGIHNVEVDKKQVTEMAAVDNVDAPKNDEMDIAKKVDGPKSDEMNVDKKADTELEASTEKVVEIPTKAFDGTADADDQQAPLEFKKSPVIRGRARSNTVVKPGLLSSLLAGDVRHGLDGDMGATAFNLNTLKESKKENK